jgi:hypothetical protein
MPLNMFGLGIGTTSNLIILLITILFYITYIYFTVD